MFFDQPRPPEGEFCNHVQVETTTEEELESSARGTVKVEVDLRADRLLMMMCMSPLGRMFMIMSQLMELIMPTATHSGITQEAVNELVAKRVEEALKAYDCQKPQN
nr:hypothetical protein [Tanacetum cinerariifolium]